MTIITLWNLRWELRGYLIASQNTHNELMFFYVERGFILIITHKEDKNNVISVQNFYNIVTFLI